MVTVGDSGDAVVKLSDSELTYPSEEAAWAAGENHLAQGLRDAIVTAVGLRTGALR
jgi:hypothetical protein